MNVKAGMGIKERVRKVLPMVETPVDLRLRSAEAQSLVAVMAIREASMLDISCCAGFGAFFYFSSFLRAGFFPSPSHAICAPLSTCLDPEYYAELLMEISRPANRRLLPGTQRLQTKSPVSHSVNEETSPLQSRLIALPKTWMKQGEYCGRGVPQP